jgi:hypothetical protein
MTTKTQLTDIQNYNTSNMIFSNPEAGSIPNSPINFHRIHISTKNQDGSIGELIISTEELFSFGLQENQDMTTGLTNGYSVPLCLHSKNGATEAETNFCDKFTQIVDSCKDYILSVKDEVGKYDLEMSDLKKFHPFYWKRDKGKIDETRGPTLYPKVIVSKKNGLKIQTFFTDANTGEEINALDILKKYMYAVCALKIESIFIGNKISLQVKVYECMYRLIDTGMKRLLQRPTVVTETKVQEETVETSYEGEEDEFLKETDEEEGSIDGGEEEETVEPEPEPEPEPPKKSKKKAAPKKKK